MAMRLEKENVRIIMLLQTKTEIMLPLLIDTAMKFRLKPEMANEFRSTKKRLTNFLRNRRKEDND